MIWTQRDGRRIEIRLMSDDHIRHSLYMLMRGAARKQMLDDALQALSYSGGDMAEYYAHQAGDSLMEQRSDPSACFNYAVRKLPAAVALYKELKSRRAAFDANHFRMRADDR